MARTADPLARFSALTREWFAGTFVEPTPAQAQAWKAIADGHDTLVIAPTGSGKTLGGVPVGHRPSWPGTPGIRCCGHPGALHLPAQGAGRRRRAQPAHTADRNRRIAERQGQPPPDISVGVRSGDTPPIGAAS